MIQQKIKELGEMINSLPPDFYLIKVALSAKLTTIQVDIEENYVLRDHSITWGVADFESRAENAEGENWREVYNEELFEEALEEMISRHDS